MALQPQPALDRTQLEKLISRYDNPESFLSDVADILKKIGHDTKHRAANLAEKDPFLEQRATRDLRYSEAISDMLDSVNYED